MGYEAHIILDSVNTAGERLTTLCVRFPRIILPAMNTHRAFSRNGASSRAIPVRKMIDQVVAEPFAPEWFLANQPGMAGGAPLTGAAHDAAMGAWLDGCAAACAVARKMSDLGVHKQHVNRVLEPYMWQTALISSTEWCNFFRQRCDPGAQPEMQRIACLMRDALNDSVPALVETGGIHAPYTLEGTPWRAESSVARCARVSYAREGEAQAGELTLYDRLQRDGHWSPFEHVAWAAPSARSRNFTGWTQFRAMRDCPPQSGACRGEIDLRAR